MSNATNTNGQWTDSEYAAQAAYEEAKLKFGPRPGPAPMSSRPERPSRSGIGRLGFSAWHAADRSAAAAQAEWDRLTAAGREWDRKAGLA